MSNYTRRKAGEIIRYHTHQCIKPQNVATHTWNIMRIYCEKYGSPGSHVWYYILHHDVAEIYTGDMPFLAKRGQPVLKKLLDEMESDALEKMGIVMPELSEKERLQVKICDLLEMKEYAETEVQMGNWDMREVINNIDKALEKIANG